MEAEKQHLLKSSREPWVSAPSRQPRLAEVIPGHANSKALEGSYGPEANNILHWPWPNAASSAKFSVNRDQPRIWQKLTDFWEPPYAPWQRGQEHPH